MLSLLQVWFFFVFLLYYHHMWKKDFYMYKKPQTTGIEVKKREREKKRNSTHFRGNFQHHCLLNIYKNQGIKTAICLLCVIMNDMAVLLCLWLVGFVGLRSLCLAQTVSSGDVCSFAGKHTDLFGLSRVSGSLILQSRWRMEFKILQNFNMYHIYLHVGTLLAHYFTSPFKPTLMLEGSPISIRNLWNWQSTKNLI